MINIALQLPRTSFKLDARFEVPTQGVTGVFGRSGSGKTSLLRAMAGLEPGATGSVQIGADSWQGQAGFLPVDQRRVGVVFQEPSLFPHLSVEENLQYGRKRNSSAAQAIDFEAIYDILALRSLLSRDVVMLSGGEQQRVAIGRALLAAPRLLLMDEPLSALDQEARQQLMSFLENIVQQLEIPVFYVSHSSEEIARLADNLVLMQAGRVTAYGSLNEVLGQVDSPLNELEEAFSVFQCRIASHQLPYLTSLKSKGDASLHIPRIDGALNSSVRLRIRARDVSLCLDQPSNSSILNILQGQVIDISKQVERGSRTVKLDIGGESLLARVSEYSVQQLALRPGLHLFAQIKSASLIA
jgi:molybdate transport system ATP-binding protein